jgi:hypothetical protein
MGSPGVVPNLGGDANADGDIAQHQSSQVAVVYGECGSGAEYLGNPVEGEAKPVGRRLPMFGHE